MLLSSAAEWAKLNPGRLEPPGFAIKPVRRRIELASDGRLLSVKPIDLATVKDKGGLRISIPDLTRTSGVKALLAVDKASYVFGPSPMTKGKEIDKADKEHAAYLRLLEGCIACTSDSVIQAIYKFTKGNPYDHLVLPDDWSDDDMVDFSVGGSSPFSKDVVRSWWGEWVQGDELSADEGLCMVCGKHALLLKKFPQLKRIPGAQTSGSPLVSFNKAAHEHYGLEGSLNAPMCSPCASTSHGALAVLLNDERHSRTVGPFRWVWWSLGGDELHVDDLLFEAHPSEVAAMLESARTGQHIKSLMPDRFVAAALGGNSGRIVVRAWIDTALSDARANLARWFSAQAVVGKDGSRPRPMALWELLVAAAPAPGKEKAIDADAVRRLLPRLVESALLGHRIPPAIWQGAIGRVRATGDITAQQAAVLKMALLSKSDPEEEVTMTSLNPDRAEPAYQCGRLLAVLDQTQRAALGKLNSTVVNRFYGSASSSPSTSFPSLVRGAQAHIGKLRRNRPGAATAYERRMTEILDRLDTFPSRLSMKQQAEFALGFYHQRASDIAAAIAAKDSGVNVAPLAEEDIPEAEEE